MRRSFYYLFVVFSTFLATCGSSEFLSKNPNSKTIIPETVRHFQAILDDYGYINTASPPLLEISSDDYYYLPGFLNTIEEGYRNAYLWSDDIWRSTILPNWNSPYNIIFNSNIVIEGLNNMKMTSFENEFYDNTYGTALFIRAFYYYQLAQVFSPLYVESTSSSKWGLPIRKGVDINEVVNREKLDKTYQIIVQDLNNAVPMLPIKPVSVTRPSKHSCYSLLARIYNQMQKYDSAYKYSNLSIEIKDSLLDYNTESISQFNKEIIWYATINSANLPINDFGNTSVDSNLVKLYAPNDLRVIKYFTQNQLGGHYFIGNYDFSGAIFSGLATDEMFLIRAESRARLDHMVEAINDLNFLLKSRFVNDGSWVPFETVDKAVLLDKIKEERRKELCFRGIRRSDLLRFDRETSNEIIKRLNTEGSEFNMSPGDLRYIYIIPPNVISFHPNMPQNER